MSDTEFSNLEETDMEVDKKSDSTKTTNRLEKVRPSNEQRIQKGKNERRKQAHEEMVKKLEKMKKEVRKAYFRGLAYGRNDNDDRGRHRDDFISPRGSYGAPHNSYGSREGVRGGYHHRGRGGSGHHGGWSGNRGRGNGRGGWGRGRGNGRGGWDRGRGNGRGGWGRGRGRGQNWHGAKLTKYYVTFK